MNITVARAADLQDIVAMLTEYQESLESPPVVDPDKNLQYLKRIVDDENAGTIFIGRTSSKQPAAFAVVCPRPSSPAAEWVPFVLDLYVRESFRRQGFGRQIFEHVVRWARKQGHTQLRWQIENLNLTAQYMFDTYNPAITGWVGYSLDLKKE